MFNFPNTDFSKINLDWIMNKITQIENIIKSCQFKRISGELKGKTSFTIQDIKADSISMFIYSDSNTAAIPITVKYYVKYKNDDTLHAYTYNISNGINTSARTSYLELKVTRHSVFIIHKDPSAPTTSGTFRGVNSTLNYAVELPNYNEYIAKVEITNTLAFTNKSYIDIEVHEYV